MTREQLVAHLRTLGLDEARELALSATLTKETWMGPFASGAVPPQGQAVPARSGVGPLPRIALSGLLPTSAPTPGPAGVGASAAHAEAPADLEVIGLLGEGGMGRVHLARQRSLGREVAVKTLKGDVADARAVAMLREEATTMGRLEHPNVVPVHAVGRDDAGRLVLVMKRVDGVSWHDLLRDPDHPRWQVLAPGAEDRLELHLDVLAQVANALHFAHSRGVVHRDVKPENVLLGEHGEVYLADWGIATAIGGDGSTAIVGTPTYMAPEMVMGDPSKIDARTDVFLLGATLHEVLTGAPPHAGETVHMVLLAAYDPAPLEYAPAVPRELCAIARQAMAKDPADRFPSALAFRRALDERRRRAGALALIRSARALLTELEERVGEPSETEKTFDTRLVECRFAFVQALRHWPESEDARTGLDAVLRLAVRNELERENVAAARSLLAELSVADRELADAVLDLEATLGARQRDVERLRALAADEDLRIGLRARMLVLGVIIAVGAVISYYFSFGPGAAAGIPSHADIIGIAGIFVLVVGGAGTLLRRHLLANAAGRRAAVLLACALLGLLSHRVIGAAHGVPTQAILAMDFVIMALVTGAASLVVPRVAWAAPIPLLGAGLTVLYPDSVAFVFSAVSVVGVFAVALLWLGGARSGDPPS
ncbi:MAG: serine/threonine protein kinase [Sandaracinaceae bacterium]|nr:serine/threonine protein kinase [Sandaracinaceae bacterium]